MKSIARNSLAGLMLLAALTVTVQLAAQDQVQNKKHSRYSVKDLGTLGGTQIGANSINNRGWVTGHSNMPGDQEEHAFLWREGVMTDLGTLGGFNSNVPLSVKNDKGLIAGQAQTSEIDPLGENFFGPFTCDQNGDPCQGGDLINLGFLWQDGVITPLPTLGGNNGVAFGANNRRQVVGAAENSTQDPACIAPQVLDYEAVIWGPKQGEIHQLPPLPGDSVAGALAINDRGQVVGTSGACVSPSALAHAVLWQNGSATNLGNLGGALNNIAFAINNQGQIVGQSDLPGDATFHAFLWQNGAMVDLGTLPGDFLSAAYGINNKGQAEGQSCDQSGNCRAFLWENGVMTDLNTLIPQGSSLYLIEGSDINDRGEIVGNAIATDTGNERAFLATRCDEKQGEDEGCKDFAEGTPVVESTTSERPKSTLNENARNLLKQRRSFGRLLR